MQQTLYKLLKTTSLALTIKNLTQKPPTPPTPSKNNQPTTNPTRMVLEHLEQHMNHQNTKPQLPTKITLAILLTTTTLLTTAGPATTTTHKHVNTPGKQTNTRPQTCTITSGTHTGFKTKTGPRTYIIHTPKNPGPNTTVIISLHGATGSAQTQQNTSQLDTITKNTITIYPQSQGTPPNTIWNANPHSEDTQYITKLTRHLHKHGCGNPKTTHINGFSMGAMTTARTICEHPRLYKSAAMISGALNPEKHCPINKNTTILIIHGKNDDVIPYNSTLPTLFNTFTGYDKTTKLNQTQIGQNWAKTKHCNQTNSHKQTPKKTQTTTTCPGGNPTTTLIHTGTHTWNPPNQPNHTSNLIWKTIQKQQKHHPQPLQPHTKHTIINNNTAINNNTPKENP